MEPAEQAAVTWRRSLAVRFTLLTGAAVLLVSAVSGYMGLRTQQAMLLDLVRRQGDALAELLAANSASALFAFNYPVLETIVEGFSRSPVIRFVQIREKSGNVVMARGEATSRGTMVLTRDAHAGTESVGTVAVGVSTEAADHAVAAAWWTLLAREGLALLGLVGVLAFLVRREVTRPLGALDRMLSQAEATGDVTVRMPVRRADEIGRLTSRFNAFMDTLQEMLVQVRIAASRLAEASRQVSSATEQLSSGTQQTASSLEETAASLEQITGTVKQNADNAGEANQLALGSRDTAEKGGRIVAAAVTAMTEINASSRRIAEIISTIDEIAFQTNLLALNAAVEAARAGDQGRGFAVVAAEVRGLAQRAAAAAREIKVLIQESVVRVEKGADVVNRSGRTLEEIVASVNHLTGIVCEIAAASQEQAQGIDQVNRAVSQMDQVVQANAAQTERLSVTARSLAGQAAELQRVVARFNLGTVSETPAALRPPSDASLRATPVPVVTGPPARRVVVRRARQPRVATG